MKTKILLAAVLAVFVTEGGLAQKFEWGLRFDTKFDNREYGAVKYLGDAVPSQTFFSVRLAPVVGIGWGEHHRIVAGGSFTFNMGLPAGKRLPEPLVYYNYHSQKYGLFAGKFERRHLIGAYSSAIYAGSFVFYDNVIDGFAMQYHPRRGKLELVLDWDGMPSKTMRESFRILSAVEYNPTDIAPIRWLTAGYSFDMYHLANSRGGSEGVVDHIIVNPWAGAAFERLAPWFERLTLTAGWINAFERERAGDNRWLTPGGVSIDFTIQKKRVGIRNTFYTGGRLMPLRHIYSSRINRGDPFFVSTKINNFTRIYWNPHLARGVDLTLELGIHTDGKHIGLQQVAWVGVTLDNSFFKRK
jgi:hypothetical protein